MLLGKWTMSYLCFN